jgi:hypothetical protein
MPFDPIDDNSYSTESHGKGLIMGDDVDRVGLLEDSFGDGEILTPTTTTLSEVATEEAAPSLADSIIAAAIGSFSLIIRTG